MNVPLSTIVSRSKSKVGINIGFHILKTAAKLLATQGSVVGLYIHPLY